MDCFLYHWITTNGRRSCLQSTATSSRVRIYGCLLSFHDRVRNLRTFRLASDVVPDVSSKIHTGIDIPKQCCNPLLRLSAFVQILSFVSIPPVSPLVMQCEEANNLLHDKSAQFLVSCAGLQDTQSSRSLNTVLRELL